MRNSLLLCILCFPLLLGTVGCNDGSGTVNRMQLTISTGALPNGTVGTAYGPAALSASGGMTPYTWSWMAQAGSSLPPGLSIKSNNDSTGTISGTPATAGTFTQREGCAHPPANLSTSARAFI